MGRGIVGTVWLASAFWDFWRSMDFTGAGYYVVKGVYKFHLRRNYELMIRPGKDTFEDGSMSSAGSVSARTSLVSLTLVNRLIRIPNPHQPPNQSRAPHQAQSVPEELPLLTLSHQPTRSAHEPSRPDWLCPTFSNR
jgi:hypothetical protein